MLWEEEAAGAGAGAGAWAGVEVETDPGVGVGVRVGAVEVIEEAVGMGGLCTKADLGGDVEVVGGVAGTGGGSEACCVPGFSWAWR